MKIICVFFFRALTFDAFRSPSLSLHAKMLLDNPPPPTPLFSFFPNPKLIHPLTPSEGRRKKNKPTERREIKESFLCFCFLLLAPSPFLFFFFFWQWQWCLLLCDINVLIDTFKMSPPPKSPLCFLQGLNPFPA